MIKLRYGAFFISLMGACHDVSTREEPAVQFRTMPPTIVRPDAARSALPAAIKPPTETSDSIVWFATPQGFEQFAADEITIEHVLTGESRALLRGRMVGNVNVSLMVGAPATIAHRGVPAEQFDYFNGYITRIDVGEQSVEIVLGSWLSLLHHTANCAVFESLTVPEAIHRVLSRHPFAEYEFRLSQEYPIKESIIQYRETDLNFVRRMSEDLGLHILVEHTSTSHKVVFTDSQPREATRTIKFLSPSEHDADVFGEFYAWKHTWSVQSIGYALRSSEAGLAELDGEKRGPDMIASHLHMYDYEPAGRSAREIENFAQIRLDESRSKAEVISAQIQRATIGVGEAIALVAHPMAHENQSYLVISVSTMVDARWRVRGNPRLQPNSEVTMIALSTRYRPSRQTPWPTESALPAVVLTTEKTSTSRRARVRFAWDKSPRARQEGSAWVKLGSGARDPREGEEVIVSFLQGDSSNAVIVD